MSTSEPRPSGPGDARSPEPDRRYKCPLCGREFEASDKSCVSCPMARSCNVVCCPNCGYGFAQDSRLVGWLRRLFRRNKQQEQERKEETR
jgi:transposase-like protein